MKSKIRELKELKALAEELAAEISSIEDEIKAAMTAQGVDEMTVDVYKVRWKPVTTCRFDSKAFKERYCELYEAFTRSTTTRRFTIA